MTILETNGVYTLTGKLYDVGIITQYKCYKNKETIAAFPRGFPPPFPALSFSIDDATTGCTICTYLLTVFPDTNVSLVRAGIGVCFILARGRLLVYSVFIFY